MARLHYTTTIILCAWFLATRPCLSAPCSVCQDGSKVPLEEKGLGRNDNNAAIPIRTCGELDSIVGGLGDQMANCQSARAVGSFCGCPIPDNACRLCGETLFVGLRRASWQTRVDAQGYIHDAPSTNMTCESVESFLHSMEYSEEGVCSEVKGIAREECCVDASEVRVTGATEAPVPTVAPTLEDLIEDTTLNEGSSAAVYNQQGRKYVFLLAIMGVLGVVL